MEKEIKDTEPSIIKRTGLWCCALALIYPPAFGIGYLASELRNSVSTNPELILAWTVVMSLLFTTSRVLDKITTLRGLDLGKEADKLGVDHFSYEGFPLEPARPSRWRVILGRVPVEVGALVGIWFFPQVVTPFVFSAVTTAGFLAAGMNELGSRSLSEKIARGQEEKIL